MTDTLSHGLFSWADVAVPDPSAGKSFYTELFGWIDEDQLDDDGNNIYTLFRMRDKLVAGLGLLPQEQQDQGMPPVWSSYVNVDSVDDVVARVEDVGGKVLFVVDVMDSGRMAYIADPTGAVLGLWEPRRHRGAEMFNEPGAMAWNELNTRDPAAAQRFYGAVFPWRFDSHGGTGYTMAFVGDKPNGGVLAIDDTWPADVPSHWMVYFAVEDTDRAAARVAELGGEVHVPPFDTPAGRIAVVADPQGAVFSLITSMEPAQG